MAEPLAWYRHQQGDRIYFDSKKWDNCLPLYTHPKEWVGLTDEEMVFLRARVQEYTPLDSVKYGEAIQRAMTQALKEKNT